MNITNLVTPNSDREDGACDPPKVEHSLKPYPTSIFEACNSDWLTSGCRLNDVHVETGSPSSLEKRAESLDWKALTRLITERGEVTASSAQAEPGTGTTVMAPADDGDSSVMSDKGANEIDACRPGAVFRASGPI